MRVFSYLGNAKPDYRSLMREQKDLLIEGVSIPVNRLVVAEQTHSKLVHQCTAADCGAGLGDHPQIAVADGFITDIPNQFLLIRTADCTPVLIYDPSGKAVAALHSGREGTRKNIAGQAVKQLVESYSCKPQDLLAVIGAGICAEHYEVSPQIYDDFITSLAQMGIEAQSPRYRHLDIQGSIYRQLIHAGLLPGNIHKHEICTFEREDYFSFRRDGTHNRQINLIGIQDE